jgi:hypothetical protein
MLASRWLAAASALIAVSCSHTPPAPEELSASGLFCATPGTKKPLEYTFAFYTRPPAGLAVDSVDKYGAEVNELVQSFRARWMFAALLTGTPPETGFVRQPTVTRGAMVEPSEHEHLRRALWEALERTPTSPKFSMSLLKDAPRFSAVICPEKAGCAGREQPITKRPVTGSDLRIPAEVTNCNRSFMGSRGRGTGCAGVSDGVIRAAISVAIESEFRPGDQVRSVHLQAAHAELAAACRGLLQSVASSSELDWEVEAYRFFLEAFRRNGWTGVAAYSRYSRVSIRSLPFPESLLKELRRDIPLRGTPREALARRVGASASDQWQREGNTRVCWTYLSQEIEAEGRQLLAEMSGRSPASIYGELYEGWSQLRANPLSAAERMRAESALLLEHFIRNDTRVSEKVEGDWRVLSFRFDPTRMCKHARSTSELFTQ